MENVKNTKKSFNIGDTISYNIDTNENLTGKGVIIDVFEVSNTDLVYKVRTSTGDVFVSKNHNILPYTE